MSRVLPNLLVVIFVAACIAESTIAWSNFASSVGTPAYVTKADFDQAFADVATGRRPTTNVNRDRKRDRLSVSVGSYSAAPTLTNNSTVVRKNAVSPELANGTPARQKAFEIDEQPAAKPTHVPHCEPVASPFVDPALARIIGRCFV